MTSVPMFECFVEIFRNLDVDSPSISRVVAAPRQRRVKMTHALVSAEPRYIGHYRALLSIPGRCRSKAPDTAVGATVCCVALAA